MLRQGAEGLPLSPDLEYDLAACVSARDSSQRLANLAQRQDCFDLRPELACVDQAGECLQPLPASVGGERFADDAPLELERTEWGYHRDRPAAVTYGTHCLVLGLATDAIE